MKQYIFSESNLFENASKSSIQQDNSENSPKETISQKKRFNVIAFGEIAKFPIKYVKFLFAENSEDTKTDDKSELIRKIYKNKSINQKFSEIDLSCINLRGADLSEINLQEINLSCVNFNLANLTSANLTSANLTSANLTSANLTSAKLSLGNLICANLSGANLSGANLTLTNLSVANLSGANLSGANLRGANLSGANLSGANLEKAIFLGANLSGAIFRDNQGISQQLKLNFIARGAKFKDCSGSNY